MISYLKTQWFNLLVGLVNLGLSIYYIIQNNEFLALGWLLSASIWISMSRVEYNHDRITLLEEKAKKYDALAEEVKAMRELQQTSDKLIDQRLNKLEEKK